jgi:hypothetical protein
MAMSNNAISRFIDPNRAGSFTYNCRQHRIEEFRRCFPDLADMHVLDLGGTAHSWRAAGLRAKSVTLVNLDDFPVAEEPWIHAVQGDACAGGFGKFDLVFSNSLLEHLGGHAKRQQFADVVRESAPDWWVQTPYRYFPVEPHWVFPWFQFLPFRARTALTEHWDLGHMPARKDRALAAELVASVELISATEMRSYFPESQIWFERFFGLPKSLVAVQTST